jgi:cytochrome c peroxidase
MTYKKGGTDRLPHSLGINNAEGDINAPTVFNSSFNFRQFWDGRAATLEEQIEGPVHNPKEMGSHWQEIIGKLKKEAAYLKAFKALYADGINAKNIKDAIATFERSLITPNAPFDQYLRGDETALTDEEKQGYALFKQYGCVACHQGINIGGNMYQVFGVLNNYFEKRGNITKADLGRFNVTAQEYDRHKFKVPSLRNVALTAPYFHDGSADTLEKAVDVMAKYQLGRKIPKKEKRLIVQFLKTLTGTYKGKKLK